jgi:dihydrofolate reductase
MSFRSPINLDSAKLIFSAITSLDGYIEDADGRFEWAAPDDEVLAFVNDLERPIGTYLYGRRMYETMVYWETAQSLPNLSSGSRDFMEIWQSADKIVYSSSLESVSSTRTQIRRQFDAEAVRELKSSLSSDLTVGGPHLAAQAFQAGLVDECQLFLTPTVVGDGKRALPAEVRLEFELVDERRFAGGVVFLNYRLRH